MKISYIIHHGYAERCGFDSRADGTLTLSFEPSYDGILTVGTSAYSVKDGVAAVSNSLIPNGIFTPVLTTEDGIYRCESFEKLGEKIHIPKTDEDTIRRLIVRCRNLELTLDTIDKKVKELESLCKGHGILNFERKEK